MPKKSLRQLLATNTPKPQATPRQQSASRRVLLSPGERLMPVKRQKIRAELTEGVKQALVWASLGSYADITAITPADKGMLATALDDLTSGLTPADMATMPYSPNDIVAAKDYLATLPEGTDLSAIILRHKRGARRNVLRYSVGEVYSVPYGFSYPLMEEGEYGTYGDMVKTEGEQNRLVLQEPYDEPGMPGWIAEFYIEGYTSNDGSIAWDDPIMVLVSDEQLAMLQPTTDDPRRATSRRKVKRGARRMDEAEFTASTGIPLDYIYDAWDEEYEALSNQYYGDGLAQALAEYYWDYANLGEEEESRKLEFIDFLKVMAKGYIGESNSRSRRRRKTKRMDEASFAMTTGITKDQLFSAWGSPDPYDAAEGDMQSVYDYFASNGYAGDQLAMALVNWYIGGLDYGVREKAAEGRDILDGWAREYIASTPRSQAARAALMAVKKPKRAIDYGSSSALMSKGDQVALNVIFDTVDSNGSPVGQSSMGDIATIIEVFDNGGDPASYLGELENGEVVEFGDDSLADGEVSKRSKARPKRKVTRYSVGEMVDIGDMSATVTAINGSTATLDVEFVNRNIENEDILIYSYGDWMIEALEVGEQVTLAAYGIDGKITNVNETPGSYGSSIFDYTARFEVPLSDLE